MKTATEDLIKELVQEIIENIPAGDFTRYDLPQQGRGDEEQAVLVVSDMQLGHKTPTFNGKVAIQRGKNLVRRVIKIVRLQRKSSAIKVLNIFILGDIVHNERVGKTIDLDELDFPLMEQMFSYSIPILENLILNMASEFEHVNVFMVQGNHGRMSKYHAWTTNMDGVVYKFLEQRLGGVENVTVYLDFEKFYFLAKIYEWRFMLMHGDQIPMHLNLPWYGVTTRSMRLQGSVERFDYLVLGHFHTPAILQWNDIEIVMNGCWVSDDQWPLRNMGMSAIPKQTLFFVHPRQGITARYVVKLG